MSVSLLDIGWIAGFLEGEGSFCIGFPNYSRRSPSRLNKYFYICAVSTDEDTINKAVRLLTAGSYSSWHNGQSTCKRTYRFKVNGKRAISWMMTIYPLMSTRRKEQIRNVISQWREYTTKTNRGKYER